MKYTEADIKKAIQNPAFFEQVRKVEQVVQDAPWHTNELATAIAVLHPNGVWTWNADEMNGMEERGFRMRAVTKLLRIGDSKPIAYLLYTPETPDERASRQLGEMVRGDDLKRTGLRQS